MALSRELIDADAERVVRRLARAGHKAYLVGGCVRDLLLARTPKDFDVATSATPTEIKQLFRNCRIIGRRFRLAHVFYGTKIIETSTFRANPRQEEEETDTTEEILIRRDNVFGSETDDAQRRDFTINGLFFDIAAEQVIDHVGGLADLEARVVRTIGDPDIRFREDPVRILRAIKFAARLGFAIETATFEALVRHRDEISKCSPARVVEELYRMLRGGSAAASMQLMRETGVLKVLSPAFAHALEGASIDTEREDAPSIASVSQAVLQELDRYLEDAEAAAYASNALLLACALNPLVFYALMRPGVRPGEANDLITALLMPICRELHVAKRDSERIRQLLLAQRRLTPSRRRRGRPLAVLRRDYFEESLAVYEMLARAEGRDSKDVAYWHKILADGGLHEARASAPAGDDPEVEDGQPRRRRRRRRGGRRRRREADDAPSAPASA